MPSVRLPAEEHGQHADLTGAGFGMVPGLLRAFPEGAKGVEQVFRDQLLTAGRVFGETLSSAARSFRAGGPPRGKTLAQVFGQAPGPGLLTRPGWTFPRLPA